MPVLNGEYVSPYGKPQGLAARLLEWAERMATDRSLPWAGLGIIEDLKLSAKVLNSREFLEHLRVHGDGEQAQFAQELLDMVDTVEACESAVYVAGDRRDLGADGRWTDPPRAIEILAGQVDEQEAAAAKAEQDFADVRAVLVQTGALAADDTETPVADLLRALLS